ncbi:MAG: hypothetical protein V1844_07680 [Pseudomonadota bacterium]
MLSDNHLLEKPSRSRLLLILSILVLIAVSTHAQEAPSSLPASGPSASVLNKPAWLTELSLELKESYDDNLQGVSGDGMPKSYSWITTLTPKIGLDLAPLINNQRVLQVLSLNYEPAFASYSQASDENNLAHRILNKIKAKSDNISFSMDNSFTYIDGSSVAPIYPAPDNVRSSYAHTMPRERRNQYQDRTKIEIQLDWYPYFVRPTGSLQYWDMLTDQRATSGYQNWVDRYEINGGVDFGRSISSQLAVFMGYRYGRQYQDKVINSVYSSTNDYHRALIGIEGKLFNRLTLSLLGGPDFRKYDDTAPVNDKNQVNFYGEASLTGELSKQDTVTFKYKGTRWISSTGQIPTFDSSFDLGYRHKFDATWIWNLNCQIKNADYTIGNLNKGSAPSLRNDWLYAFSTGLSHDFNAHIGINISLAANLGRNAQDGIPNANYRQFDEYLTTIGIFSKF